jgi:hypothetical protein
MRISYSSMTKLHACERLFQLDKILAVGSEYIQTPDTNFGSAFGAGAQHYLVHRDPDAAIFEAFMVYDLSLQSEKKTIEKLVNALAVTFFKIDDLLQDYDIAYIDGKPAIELSFRLDFDEAGVDYYVGFIDAVLKHKWTGMLVVLEVKTTGIELLDISPLYRHSGQALGYSIVLDKISPGARNFQVLYLVAQLGRGFNPTVHLLPFEKTINNRLEWFLTLKMDYTHIQSMKEMNIFPRRGSACLQYNKPCKHFGTCELTSFDRPVTEPVDNNVYQFHYKLDELIDDHLRLLTEGAI